MPILKHLCKHQAIRSFLLLFTSFLRQISYETGVQLQPQRHLSRTLQLRLGVNLFPLALILQLWELCSIGMGAGWNSSSPTTWTMQEKVLRICKMMCG